MPRPKLLANPTGFPITPAEPKTCSFMFPIKLDCLKYQRNCLKDGSGTGCHYIRTEPTDMFKSAPDKFNRGVSIRG